LRSVVLTLLLLGACGGASFRDGVYEDEHARYRVGSLRGGWERFEVGDNDLAFHKRGMGTISVNSTCSDYEDVPPVALLNHLLFEMTERRFLVEETVTLDGRGARHVVVQVELDGVPLELEIYLLKKDGCVFDLTHVRERSVSAEARATFVAFVQRFAVMETHPDA
jgi:hypothetical protein